LDFFTFFLPLLPIFYTPILNLFLEPDCSFPPTSTPSNIMLLSLLMSMIQVFWYR